MTIPKALAKQLAVVAIVTGSVLAATVVFTGVDLLKELGSIKTRFEPPANRTPVDLPTSLDLIAHCIFCGAKFVRGPWPAALL